MADNDELLRPQRRGRRISMTPTEIDTYLAETLTCRVASNGPNGPHASPLWFYWDGSAVWLYSIVRSQRWSDLQRDPRVALVMDSGQDWSELQGVEIQGRAEPYAEVPRVGAEHSELLAAVESGFHKKYRTLNPNYQDRPNATFEWDGRHAWLRVVPTKLSSWDFRKIS